MLFCERIENINISLGQKYQLGSYCYYELLMFNPKLSEREKFHQHVNGGGNCQYDAESNVNPTGEEDEQKKILALCKECMTEMPLVTYRLRKWEYY